MLESILLWLTAAFVVVAALSVAGFFLFRWLFVRTAERMSQVIERQVGSLAGYLIELTAETVQVVANRFQVGLHGTHHVPCCDLGTLLNSKCKISLRQIVVFLRQVSFLGLPDGRHQFFERIQKMEMDRIVAILTPEQKTRWQELIGRPFEGQLERRGGWRGR